MSMIGGLPVGGMSMPSPARRVPEHAGPIGRGSRGIEVHLPGGRGRVARRGRLRELAGWGEEKALVVNTNILPA